MRELSPGDELLAGETLILAAGATITISYGTGPDAEVMTFEGPEGEGFSVVAAGQDEAVVASPELVRIIDEELLREANQETDADRPDRVGDGHRFVELVRIDQNLEADGITPLNLARVEERIPPMTVDWGDPEQQRVEWPYGTGRDDDQAINRVPEPAPDVRVIAEDEIATGNVLDNDFDNENNTLTVTQFEIGGEIHAAGDTVTIPGVGTILIEADGSYTFTPVADWNGVVPTVTYTADDGRGGVATSTLDITVEPAVDVEADEIATHAGDPVTTDVLANDSFANDDAEVTGVTQGEHGTVVINPDGTVTYTPVDGYVGPDSYTYTVTSGGKTETTTVTVEVTNAVPVATPEVETTPEDSPLSGNVLANESDADGDPLTVTQYEVGGRTYAPGEIAVLAGIGSLVLNADGSYTFTPVADWNGTVPTITYTVTDGNDGGTVSSTLGITVTPVEDIASDTITTHAGDPVTTDVLGNDSFENGDAEVTAVTQGEHGTVVINPDGTVTYTPAEGYVGPDSYTYTVTSGGKTETTTVTVEVTNTAPDPAPERETTPEDTPVSGNLLENDSDADGDPLTVIGFEVDGRVYSAGETAAIPGTGTLTIGADGDYTFTPDANWNGTVPTVTYTVSDGNDGGIGTSTLDITVTPVNDAPTADILPPRADADADVIAGIDVSPAFSDVEGDTLTYAATGLPAGLTLDPVTGIISGTIDNSASQTGTAGNPAGIYTVVVTADDGNGGTVSQSFEWTVANPAPGATDDSGTTDEDTTLAVDAASGVLGNDSDPDGDALTVGAVNGNAANVGAVIAGSSGGAFTLNPDGSYSFDPNGEFDDLAVGETRTTSISYTVSDGEGGTDTATLEITVTGTNDGPVAVGTLPDQANEDADGVTTVDVTAAFADVDASDTLTYTATGLPAGLTLDPATGIISGTIDNSASQTGTAGNPAGTYTVVVTATDGSGASVTQSFEWTVANPAPDALNDADTTDEDTALTVDAAGGVLGNDSDPDGDALTVGAVNGDAVNVGAVIAGSSGGAFTLNPDGSYGFDPNGEFDDLAVGETRTTSITYTVSDGEGGTDTATLEITVTGTNDGPVAVGTLPDQANEDADGVTTVDVISAFADVDASDTLTYTATGLPAGLTLDPATGIISGTIDNSASQTGTPGNPAGTYTVVVTADDGHGGTVSQSFTWTVANPVPSATDDSGATDEDTALAVDAAGGVLGNDSDPDGDALTVGAVNGDAANVGAVIAGSSGGAFTLNPDGSYGFDPNGEFDDLAVGETRTTSITYTVSDGEGGTDTATLEITVTGTNDGPVAVGTLPDQANEDADGVTTVDVTAAFADVDASDTLTYTATGLPAGLTLDPVTGIISGTIDNSASQTGTPGNPAGTYTVVVTADDGNGGTVSQSFEWTVANPVPSATDDSGATDEDTALAVDAAGGVLGNDSDPDGDALTVGAVNGDAANVGAVIAGSSGGTFTLNPDGSYGFDPNGEFDDLAVGETRTTSITYTVSDGEGGTDTATLEITVTGTNDGPVAVGALPDQANEDAEGVATIDVTSAFADVDASDTLTYTATGLPAGLTLDPVTGIISGTIDNSASQTGTAGNPAGTYTVVVTATDGSGASVTQSFEWTVANPAPDAANDTDTTDEDTVLAVDAAGGVLGNDSDPDGDALTVDAVNGDTANVGAVIAGSSGGTFTLSPDGSYGFDPNGEFDDLAVGETRTTSISYTVSDGEGGSDTATLEITVTGTNDGPVAVGTLPNQANDDADGVTTVDVTAAFADVDASDTLSYTATGLPAGLTLDPLTGIISGTIDNSASQTGTAGNPAGTYTVVVTATDGSGASVTQSFDWTVTNPAPEAAPDHGTVVEDGADLVVSAADGVIGSGSAPAGADTDPDADSLAVTHVITGTADDLGDFAAGATPGVPITGAYGTLTLNADGSYTYVLDNDNPVVNGLNASSPPLADVFSYAISDGEGGTSFTTLTITINGNDDGAPSITPADTNGAEAGEATVYEAGLTSDGPAGQSAAATGTIAISAGNGLASVTIAGLTLTLAELEAITAGTPVEIDTPQGKLTLTGYTSSSEVGGVSTGGSLNYTYTLEDTVTNPDAASGSSIENIALAVEDVAGGTSSSTLGVTIIDDAPTIESVEAATVDEANLADGTDPNAGAQTQSGSLEIRTGADSGTVTTVFDGAQTAPAGLTSNGVAVVYTVSADGLTLTATAGPGGPVVFTVTLTDPGTPSLGYDFTLTGPLDHGGSDIDLSFGFTVTDADGDSDAGSFQVSVVDDGPVAVNDPGVTLDEGGAVVVANLLGNDRAGADGDTKVVSITYTNEAGDSVAAAVPASGVTVDTRYGSLTVHQDGTWSYTSDATENNPAGVSESFGYTIEDGDGSTSTAVQPITVTDTDPSAGPVGLTLDEQDIPGAGSAGSPTNSVTEDLAIVRGPDAISDVVFDGATVSGLEAQNLTSGGTALVYTVSADGHTLTATAGAGGAPVFTLVLNNPNDAAGTSQSVTLTLTGKLDHAAAGGENGLSIPVDYTVHDTDSSAPASLDLTIVDDVPTAAADAGVSTVEGGNTVAGTSLLANDVQSADGARVNQIQYTNEAGELTTATVAAGPAGSTFDTIHGSLTVHQDGTWSYTSDPAVSAGASVDHPQPGNDLSIDDVFNYNLIDGDGDVSGWASQTVTVDDTAPSIGTPDTTAVNEANLPSGSDPDAAGLTQTGSLDVTKGADGIDVTFDAVQSALIDLGLSSGGADLVYSVSADGHTLTATAGAGGPVVFTATITDPASASAGYTFDLSRPLDHTGGGEIELPIGFGVVDGDGDVDDANFIIITITDDQPATARSFTLDEDSSGITFNTSADATDQNTVASDPANGTATVNPDGTVTYVPDANFSGTDTFDYSTTADDGTTVVTTVTVTVNPVSDAPQVPVDAGAVLTNEDEPVALGLNAPVVTDATDQNGAGAGDNPELLGAITLSGLPAGAVLLDGAGHVLLISDGSDITIQLSDGSHISGLTSNLTLSSADYEALQVLPPPESHANFTVNVGVTSYEVGDDGTPIPGVPGAASSTDVTVNVQAVTDPVELSLVDGGDADTLASDHTFAEDTSFDLADLLSVNFPSTDGNAGADTDGSEVRWFEISGLPVGTMVNGVEVTAANPVVTVAAPGLSTSPTGLPPMTITPPQDFSGDVTITVTLNAQDRDADGVGAGPTTGVVEQASVTLDLHVTPVGGDVTASDVSMPEDTAAAFLSGIEVTDQGGNGTEIITEVQFEVPAGWTVADTGGGAGYTAGQSGTTYTITFDASLTEAEREAVLDGFTIAAPAHSSADQTIDVAVTTADTVSIEGSDVTQTTTTTLPIEVTVTPVAEAVGSDSDGDGTADATMTPGHAYTTVGAEDAWFTLGTEGGFNLEAGWSDQDADEQVFARLTPELIAGDGGSSSAIGSQFRYMDGEGDWVTVTYAGSPVDIPVEYLDTLEFKAPENLSGAFEIGVETLTVDTDPDTGARVETVSGSAALSNLVIEPVADEVTMALNARATGIEDTAIPLDVRPTSSDPSETFTVTISNIPPGAQLFYDGVLQTPVGGSVTLTDFDSSKALAIQPPPNSNEDFTLGVSAVSIDGTDMSAATSLNVNVSVRGVADEATVTPVDMTYSEATLDSGADQVMLSELVSASLTDTDGSEVLTMRVTGLPEGFSLSAGTMLVGGTGAERVWVLTQEQFATATVSTPANYSGTQAFTVTPVTTENDGDSRTGSPQTVEITVTPSAEAGVTTSAVLTEDVVTPLGLGIVHQNGDADETLTTVWISVDDADSANFTLYLGGTPLSAAGLTTETIDGQSYYVLTGAQIGELGAKGAANLDGSLGSFDFKYEITDDSYGSTPAGASGTAVQDGIFDLSATPVTDAVDVSITAIAGSAGVTTVSDDVSGDDASPDSATLNAGDMVTVTLNVAKVPDAGSATGTADTDGSEKVIRVVIEGVPDGVSVQGAEYSGGGTWLLIYDDAAALPINSAGGIDLPVVFDVSGFAGDLQDVPISMQVQTQDRGELNAGTAVVSDTVTWHLTTEFTGGDGAIPAQIDQWAYNGAHASEDTEFSLSDVIDAQVTIRDATVDNTFTVSLTDIPPGTVIDGMTSTIVNGVEVWTASVTVPPGGDADAALAGLLDSIGITAPENSNANNAPGAFHLDARLTVSVAGGDNESADIDDMTVPVDPITDPGEITISPEAIDEGTASIPVTITVSNDADGAFGTIIDGTVYVKVDAAGSTNGLENGTLTHNGAPLTTEVVDGETYYVITGVTPGAPIDLVYTPDNSTAGEVSFSALVRTQESGSALVQTGTATSTGQVIMINNGVTVGTGPSSGDESSQVQITNLVVSLVDDDGSETINSVLLSNLPNGFLVYVGDSAATATLASNAGGTNTWVISNPDGSLPPYVAIVPPENWSGTLDNLSITVESGETVFDEGLIQNFDLGPVTINPVAQGVDLTATNTFGPENQIIPLNLNASMADAADASVPGAVDASRETTTLKLTGLGEFASFYIGADQKIDGVSYDPATDTYTLTGLSQADLDQLGFLQARDALTDQNAVASGVQIRVEAFTVDGESTSASDTVDLTVNSYAQLGTNGDDSLLWTGSTINAGAGTDTVRLRGGESLSGTELDTQLANVEALDLHGNAITSLSAADVLGIAGGSDPILKLLGDADDSVVLGEGWTSAGSQQIDGIEYAIFTSTVGSTQVELQVQSSISVD
ncbi:Ig-like domain-containing protein [Pelagerythrobacter rhizovicinus]|uniref:Tandem-95 repeat protein n=1 Tax=Pelagerythrobacter rhizovicinus TaxID=2268576 RepID=A0A4Q2KPQ9_9SPHN|nr:Ig-like domain-containing protein [Pelagerythrobacter rhizovicinus]RXZ65503.1 tandem-95 repeat protein [Pelagerythrobacter rhizovicinus]